MNFEAFASRTKSLNEYKTAKKNSSENDSNTISSKEWSDAGN